MSKIKRIAFTLATLAAINSLTVAQDTTPKTNSVVNAKPAASGTNAVPKTAAKAQAEVASKTAKFAIVSKTDESYKTALDAHALDAALKQANKSGAFKGKVTKIFEPRGGAMAIVNFDENYKTALTALLKKENFTNFPALTNLMNKEVMVTGTFIDFQGRAEIVLTNSAQIKLVQ